MTLIQSFQTLIRQKINYLKHIPKPVNAGDDQQYLLGIEYKDSVLVDADYRDIALIPTSLPSYTATKQSLWRLRQMLKAGCYLQQPHPDFKRPINGSPEGVRISYLSPGCAQFGTALIKGTLEELRITPKLITPGWLLPRIVDEEVFVFGRYTHWRSLYEAQQLLDTPIPEVEFRKKPAATVLIYFEHLFGLINPNWNESVQSQYDTLTYLVDWFLWSVGHPSVPQPPDPDRWTTDAHSKLYQVFSAIPMLLYPHDYFGYWLRQIRPQSTPRPLPLDKIEDLFKSLFPLKWGDYRRDLIADPDVGTGDLLIRLAGHTYNAIGFQRVDDEFDPLVTKIAIANAYLFAPWVVFPLEFLATEALTDQAADIALGKTLDVMRTKRVGKDFFTTTEPDLFSSDRLPIHIRRDLPTPVLPTTPAPQPSPTLPEFLAPNVPELSSFATHLLDAKPVTPTFLESPTPPTFLSGSPTEASSSPFLSEAASTPFQLSAGSPAFELEFLETPEVVDAPPSLPPLKQLPPPPDHE